MRDEPTITVNGIALSIGEAMTVRVALTSFASDLVLNGCGDDEHGKFMANAYLRNIKKIYDYMEIK